MSSSSQITSVISAASQSVAKVFLIGLVGFVSVLYPRKNPLMPSTSVSTMARFSFHTLTLSLIYSTTAQSINPDSIGDYWFIVVAAFASLGLSYAVATLMGYTLLPHLTEDFKALRIAATYPNIVALPILIFPSLCEHAVVYENFTLQRNSSGSSNSLSPIEACTADATSMIFVYFFGWSLCFFTFGLPELMRAAEAKQQHEEQTAEISLSRMDASLGVEVINDNEKVDSSSNPRSSNKPLEFCQTALKAIKQTCSSPGFVAMAAGILTGCIGPLRDALFEPGGPLRFIGDAIQTMGIASSSVSTIVVAASLVPLAWLTQSPEGQSDSQVTDGTRGSRGNDDRLPFWKRWRSVLNVSKSEEAKQHRREHTRYLMWYMASKLFVSPALVILLVAFLPISVPPMALLVVVVNAALPGALIVVVLLKSQGLSSAQTVAGVYLPSYVLSIFSIAAWTALGLWITIPDENNSEL